MVIAHAALRPPFVLDASAGGLSVEPNQEGERVDRSSEGESCKTDKLIFIHLHDCTYLYYKINVTEPTDDRGLLYKDK